MDVIFIFWLDKSKIHSPRINGFVKQVSDDRRRLMNSNLQAMLNECQKFPTDFMFIGL